MDHTFLHLFKVITLVFSLLCHLFMLLIFNKVLLCWVCYQFIRLCLKLKLNLMFNIFERSYLLNALLGTIKKEWDLLIWINERSVLFLCWWLLLYNKVSYLEICRSSLFLWCLHFKSISTTHILYTLLMSRWRAIDKHLFVRLWRIAVNVGI